MSREYKTVLALRPLCWYWLSALLPLRRARAFGGSVTPEAGWWRSSGVKHMSRGSRRFWKHCSAASCPERSESLLFCIQTGVGVACWLRLRLFCRA